MNEELFKTDIQEYSPDINHAIMAHIGEDDWHDKSLRRVIYSLICCDNVNYKPANDLSTETDANFVQSIKECFKDYGTFPCYHIDDLWVSFKVFPNLKNNQLRVRLYINAAHYHVYRIIMPTADAINSLLNFVKTYKQFERQWRAANVAFLTQIYP